MKEKLSNRDSVLTASFIGSVFIMFGFQNCAPQPADEPQKQNTQVIGNSSSDSSVPDPNESSNTNSVTPQTENRLKYTTETTLSSSGVPSMALKSVCGTKNSAVTTGSTVDSITEFKESRNFTCTSAINRKYFAVGTIRIFTLADGSTKASKQIEIVSESTNSRKISIGKIISGSQTVTVSANIAANVDNCEDGTITTNFTCTENRKECGAGLTLSANKSACMASSRTCSLPANATSCTETYDPQTNQYGSKSIDCKAGFKKPTSDTSKCLQETWVSAVVDDTLKKPLYCLNDMTLAQSYYKITKIEVVGKGSMRINPGTGIGFPHIAALEGGKGSSGGFKITCTLK